MKIIIKIGENPEKNEMDLIGKTFKDNVEDEFKDIENILSKKDITISNVNGIILTMANVMLARYNLIKNNKNADLSEISKKPTLNPQVTQIIQVNENGEEINIQKQDGTIKKNYFNFLMGMVLDELYEILPSLS